MMGLGMGVMAMPVGRMGMMVVIVGVVAFDDLLPLVASLHCRPAVYEVYCNCNR